MAILRFALMTLLEVLAELTRRLGHSDLSEQCEECKKEVKAHEELEQKEG